VQVGGQPDDRRPADVRVDGDAAPGSDVGDLHARQETAADRRVGLEHVGRARAGEVVVLAGGVDALTNGDRDRRARRQPGQLVGAHLRDRLLEEGDAERPQRLGDRQGGASVVEPVGIDADQGIGTDVFADRRDRRDVVGDTAAKAHLDALEAVLDRLVEVVRMEVGVLLEHRGPGAVEPKGPRCGAEQLVDRQVGGLAGDVPARDLERPDHLTGQALPAEVAVEQHMHLGEPAPDVGGIGAEQRCGADVADRRREHRRVAVAPVRTGLAPSDEPVVGLDSHDGEAARHRRVDLAIAELDRVDRCDLHPRRLRSTRERR